MCFIYQGQWRSSPRAPLFGARRDTPLGMRRMRRMRRDARALGTCDPPSLCTDGTFHYIYESNHWVFYWIILYVRPLGKRGQSPNYISNYPKWQLPLFSAPTRSITTQCNVIWTITIHSLFRSVVASRFGSNWGTTQTQCQHSTISPPATVLLGGVPRRGRYHIPSCDLRSSGVPQARLHFGISCPVSRSYFNKQ